MSKRTLQSIRPAKDHGHNGVSAADGGGIGSDEGGVTLRGLDIGMSPQKPIFSDSAALALMLILMTKNKTPPPVMCCQAAVFSISDYTEG